MSAFRIHHYRAPHVRLRSRWLACLLLALSAACAPAAVETGIPGTTATLAAPPISQHPVLSANNRDLTAALDKTRAATTYRIGFNFETGTTDNGRLQTAPFLVYDGEIKGDASHVTYNGGAFAEMLGGSSRVEVITIDGKTYVKGNKLFDYTDPDHWYYLPNSGVDKPPFAVEDLLQITGGDTSQARVIGSAAADGQNCQVWRMDARDQTAPLLDMAVTPDNKDDFSVVDSAEARFTLCPDGYVHGLEWNVLSHNSANAEDKSSLAIRVHVFDFGASNITFPAPPNPLEMK